MSRFAWLEGRVMVAPRTLFPLPNQSQLNLICGRVLVLTPIDPETDVDRRFEHPERPIPLDQKNRRVI
jgi:hypothetical protein